MKRHSYTPTVLFAATLAAILATVTPATLRAQDDISKQLEVTRAYTPRVGQAAKLPLVPNMTDTVMLRPRGHYEIAPTPWAATFPSRRFAPADISTADFRPDRPLYVRLGAGAPLQTTADLYFTPRMVAGTTFGLFVNHDGFYSKVRNDLGMRSPATELHAAAGVFGTRQWRRFTLAGDASYDLRIYDPYGSNAAYTTYGTIPDSPDRPFTVTDHFTYNRTHDRLTLGRVQGGLGFGDSFDDLSHFNFSARVRGGYAHGTEQADIDVEVKMAQMLGAGRHGFEVGISERGAIDVIESDMSAFTVTFSPRYVLSLDRFHLRAGLDVRYVRNGAYNQHHGVFTPVAEARLDLAGGRFVPFASYTSRLLDGSREALTRRNPFVVWHGPTGIANDLRVGFAGSLGGVFSYELFGGLTPFDDYQTLVARQDVRFETDDATDNYDAWYSPVLFTPVPTSGIIYTAGVRLGLDNLGGFSARLSANWNKTDFTGLYADFFPVGDLPRYDASAEVTYRAGDKFRVSAGARLIGEREYNISYRVGSTDVPTYDDHRVGRIGTVVDIFASAEAKVMPDFWIFVEGSNLAGQALYPWPAYRGRGIGIAAGIKAIF